MPALPPDPRIPDLSELAENGLGCAAFENGEMIGFLCCLAPMDNAFTTTARGTFSPIYAHGAAREDRIRIYQKLYQAAAQKWANAGISSHSIGLYAHDREAITAFFQYGFGLRCIDAIRPMTPIRSPACEGFSFFEIPPESRGRLEPLHRMLNAHFEKSPCFMKHTGPDLWITKKPVCLQQKIWKGLPLILKRRMRRKILLQSCHKYRISVVLSVCQRTGERDCIPAF